MPRRLTSDVPLARGARGRGVNHNSRRNSITPDQDDAQRLRMELHTSDFETRALPRLVSPWRFTKTTLPHTGVEGHGRSCSGRRARESATRIRLRTSGSKPVAGCKVRTPISGQASGGSWVLGEIIPSWVAVAAAGALGQEDSSCEDQRGRGAKREVSRRMCRTNSSSSIITSGRRHCAAAQ